MNAKQIVATWLKENGYDGLYDEDGECGCWAGDELMPCEGFAEHCMPGYKIPALSKYGYDFLITPAKPPTPDTQGGE